MDTFEWREHEGVWEAELGPYYLRVTLGDPPDLGEEPYWHWDVRWTEPDGRYEDGGTARTSEIAREAAVSSVFEQLTDLLVRMPVAAPEDAEWRAVLLNDARSSENFFGYGSWVLRYPEDALKLGHALIAAAIAVKTST